VADPPTTTNSAASHKGIPDAITTPRERLPRRRPSTLTELVALTIDYLRTRTAQIVANYFKAPHVSYAQ